MTLDQRHSLDVYPTNKSRPISTLIQRHGLTLDQRWSNVIWPTGMLHIFIPPLLVDGIRKLDIGWVTYHASHGFSLNKSKYFITFNWGYGVLNVKTKSMLHIYVVPLVEWYQASRETVREMWPQEILAVTDGHSDYYTPHPFWAIN